MGMGVYLVSKYAANIEHFLHISPGRAWQEQVAKRRNRVYKRRYRLLRWPQRCLCILQADGIITFRTAVREFWAESQRFSQESVCDGKAAAAEYRGRGGST